MKRSQKKSAVMEWVEAILACVLIMLAAWGVAAAMTALVVKAWAKDPMPPVSDVQRQIAIEAVALEGSE